MGCGLKAGDIPQKGIAPKFFFFFFVFFSSPKLYSGLLHFLELN